MNEKLEAQSKDSYGEPTEARNALALLEIMNTNGVPTVNRRE
jgi:hypothetical protein